MRILAAGHGPRRLPRCRRLGLSRNHRGIRVGRLNFDAAVMIVWSGTGNCALSVPRPRPVRLTSPPRFARRALAGRAAEPNFQRTEDTGNYPYKWIHVKGQAAFFLAELLAAGRIAASRFVARASGSRENGEMPGKNRCRRQRIDNQRREVPGKSPQLHGPQRSQAPGIFPPPAPTPLPSFSVGFCYNHGLT